VTLIELLVVVSILMTVAVIALPLMGPAMEGRKIRETARAINVFIGAVRNQAIETGRPCGVLIRRMQVPSGATLTQETYHSQSGVVLEQVEIPAPDAGLTEDATVRVQDCTWNPDRTPPTWYWNPAGVTTKGPCVLKVQLGTIALGGPACIAPQLIRYGDLMQLDSKGPWYTIARDDMDTNTSLQGCGTDYDFPVDSNGFIDFGACVDSDNDRWIDNRILTLVLPAHKSVISPWLRANPHQSPFTQNWSRAVSFKIFRQPYLAASGVTRSAVLPMQIPVGLVLDLKASGVDNSSDPTDAGNGDWFAAKDADTGQAGIQDPSPVVIIFGPNGAVQGVVCSKMGSAPVTSPIHLLLGKWDRMLPTRPDDNYYNYQDISNFWISIQPASGLVTVTEPYADPASIDPTLQTRRPLTLYESRYTARMSQINTGGR
jgi:type II secretory pathway pseudopilin PulG